MAFDCINSRTDLDALTGKPEHAIAMAALAATLWRLERDDEAQTWRAVKDDSVIARFGLKRTDFKGARAPALPEYVPVPVAVPPVVSRAQGKSALIRAGLWEGVLAFVAAIPDPVERALAEVALHDTQNWERASPFLNAAAAGMGIADAEMDALFVAAGGIAF